ncbi:MAG: ABC transporter permease [Betaproteobacteria bacterium]|nr:ABC transporter permease [Betaproteobacteria bacterium]MBM3726723.1 ABC transporter permease [Acidobacteriota bacterium]
MTRFLVRRLAVMLPLTLLVLSISFFLVQSAPGSPFASAKSTEAAQARMRAKYGLDQPKHVQYGRYMARLAGFTYNSATAGYEWRPYPDFGESLSYQGRTVNDILLAAVPVSAFLGLFAYAMALVLGCGMGVLAAVRRNSWVDNAISGFAALATALPSFILGPLLVMLFSLTLYWLPPARLEWAFEWGYLRIPTLRTILLPAVTLAIAYVGYIAKLVRSSLIDVLGQDYVRTARAKGLPEWRVVVVHALRGALLPVVSFSGLALADLITGAVAVEAMFAIPGMGHYFIDATNARDYFLILGLTAFATIAVMMANLFVDIAYTWIDPRIRYE